MRGILFNQDFDLLRKVYTRQKTETRRTGGLEKVNEPKTLKKVNFATKEFVDNKLTANFYIENSEKRLNHLCKATSRYQLNEILYLKESYRVVNGTVEYKLKTKTGTKLLPGKFENKLFMPAKYARGYIQITGIDIQQIKNISQKSLFEEGVETELTTKNFGYKFYDAKRNAQYTFGVGTKPSDIFLVLVNSVNSKTKVVSNDITPDHWVFVYTFTLLKNKPKGLKNV